jgi:hypothetical protein
MALECLRSLSLVIVSQYLSRHEFSQATIRRIMRYGGSPATKLIKSIDVDASGRHPVTIVRQICSFLCLDRICIWQEVYLGRLSILYLLSSPAVQ